MLQIAGVLGTKLLLGTLAGPAPSSFELSVVSKTCGTEDAVRARIGERLRSNPRPGWRFDVTVAEDKEGIRATVSTRSPAGQLDQRSVTGMQCNSVLDAVALVVAVTLDPSLVEAPKPTAPAQVVAATTQPESATTDGRVHLGAVGGLGLGSAIATDWGWEAGIGFRLAYPSRQGSQLTLEFVHGWGDVEHNGLSAQLNLNAGRLRVMPLRIPILPSIGLAPILGFQAGSLRGSTSLPDAQNAGGSYVSTGLEAALVGNFGSFDVSVGPGVELPLKQDRFRARDQELFRVPTAAWTTRFQLGWWLD